MNPTRNIWDAESTQHGHGGHFEARTAPLADRLGAKQIGANVTRVPPGKAAWPFHHHFANEEHFFIVRGTGTLRLGAATHPVKPGDYIVSPAGGPELAHQLINTGAEELVYLALSTKLSPEVVGYPDTGKTGVGTLAPDGSRQRFLVEDRLRDTKAYWEGEDGAAIRAITKSD
jgi:uncharacterized cupin superfamily protein